MGNGEEFRTVRTWSLSYPSDQGRNLKSNWQMFLKPKQHIYNHFPNIDIDKLFLQILNLIEVDQIFKNIGCQAIEKQGKLKKTLARIWPEYVQSAREYC